MLTIFPTGFRVPKLKEQKAATRKQAGAARKLAAQQAGDAAATDLAALFVDQIPLGNVAAVSGFLPIGSEMDVRPLLNRLRAKEIEVSLPVVIGNDLPLVFRKWCDGDPLIEEEFGTKAPGPEAKELVPDLLIVPMLAFDRLGYRLGYGGGFYDRTLARLRRDKRIVAVGVAYAGQEIDVVPRDELDQPLDRIVTEKEVIRIN